MWLHFWPKNFVLVQLLFIRCTGLASLHCSLVTPFQVALLPPAWCCLTLPRGVHPMLQLGSASPFSCHVPCGPWKALPSSTGLQPLCLSHSTFYSCSPSFSPLKLATTALPDTGTLQQQGLHITWESCFPPHCPLLWLIHLKQTSEQF